MTSRLLTSHGKLALKLGIALAVFTASFVVSFLLFDSLPLSFFISSALTALSLHVNAATVKPNGESQSEHKQSKPELKTLDIVLFSDNSEHIQLIRDAFRHHKVAIIDTASVENCGHLAENGTAQNLIIDTSLNTQLVQTVIELCREKQGEEKRLPLVALQKEEDIKIKLQLLSMGFDDSLSLQFNENEMTGYCSRWLGPEYLISQDSPTIKNQVSDEGDKSSQKKILKRALTHAQHKHKKSLKVVSIQQSLKASNNDHQLAGDMLSMLSVMLEENKEELERLYILKDWRELGELVHKIKGGCFMCGVPALTERVTIIDQALSEKSLEHIDQNYAEMMQAIDDLLVWKNEHEIELIFTDPVES